MLLYSKEVIFALQLLFSTRLLLLIPISASAQATIPTASYFVKPPQAGDNDDFSQNPTWYLNTTEEILWNTTSQNFYIALFQQQIGGGIQGQNVYGMTTLPLSVYFYKSCLLRYIPVDLWNRIFG